MQMVPIRSLVHELSCIQEIVISTLCVIQCQLHCTKFLIGHLYFIQLFKNKIKQFQTQYLPIFRMVNELLGSKKYTYKISMLCLS